MTYLSEIWYLSCLFHFQTTFLNILLITSTFFLSIKSEPSIRGVLLGFCGISSSCGIFMVYLLGAFLSWRQVALICISIPASTVVAIYFVPEVIRK